MSTDSTGKTMQAKFSFPYAALRPNLLASPYWLGHIPFAAELIRRLRPTMIVELGTYTGSSLSAFCLAAERANLPCKCYGVDLWEGDIHMGKFEKSMYDSVQSHFEKNHPQSAVLIRKSFDEAVSLFEDGSVDLLHIDGTHTYDAVANDFTTWKPKLSRHSVVLFHDINVTRANVGEKADEFGVRKFFDSLKPHYPTLEFLHSYGLGVLFFGTDLAPEVRDLLQLSTNPRFYPFFALRGNRISRLYTERTRPSLSFRIKRFLKHHLGSLQE